MGVDTISSFFSICLLKIIRIVSWLRPFPDLIISMQSKLPIAQRIILELIEFGTGTQGSPKLFANV